MPGAKGTGANAEDEIVAGEMALGRLEYDEAYKHFEKATKIDPKSAVAYFGLAEASLGIPTIDAEKVLASYRKAIELDPGNPQYHEALASMCMDLGRFNEAEQAYAKAAEIDKDNAPFYFSEFAIHYRNKAPIVMEQFLDEKTKTMIAQKALTYALKALNMDKDEARRLL